MGKQILEPNSALDLGMGEDRDDPHPGLREDF